MNVVIFGTGEFAEIVFDHLSKSSDHNVVGFTVNKEFVKSNKFLNLPLVPFETIEEYFPPNNYQMFVALGYTNINKKRENIFNQAKNKGYNCISFVHPSCEISENFKYGENCFVFENNVIQRNVILEDNVIVWSGNIISHHNLIKKNCFIISGVIIGGHVILGENSFVGLGAIIRNSITIGKECVIGAGTVILENTNNNEVYVSKGTVKLDILSTDLKQM